MANIRALPTDRHGAVTGGVLRQSLPELWSNTAEPYHSLGWLWEEVHSGACPLVHEWGISPHLTQ